MGRTACTEPQYLYKGAFYLYVTYVIDLSDSNTTVLDVMW